MSAVTIAPVIGLRRARTTHMRTRGCAAIAASTALQFVASRCSRAKVTSRIEFAEATPTAMIAPKSEGIDMVVCVMKRLITMPEKASGRAQSTTKGSPQLW